MRVQALILSVALLILPAPLFADTYYSYTGNAFEEVQGNFTTSDSISGIIDLAAALPDDAYSDLVVPISFSFTDGIDTFTNTNTIYSNFTFYTDANGDITAWFDNISTYDATIQFYNLAAFPYGPPAEDAAQDGFGTYSANFDDPGVWVDPPGPDTPPAVPEPSPLLLVATGLLGALPVLRRRVSTLIATLGPPRRR
jgi:hypothetical protein